QYIERPTGVSTWYKVSYGPMIGYVPASSVIGEAKLLSQNSLTSGLYRSTLHSTCRHCLRLDLTSEQLSQHV
ncbi:hypothetical protein ACW7EJ_06210, partial [Acinetobacter soli]